MEQGKIIKDLNGAFYISIQKYHIDEIITINYNIHPDSYDANRLKEYYQKEVDFTLIPFITGMGFIYRAKIKWPVENIEIKNEPCEAKKTPMQTLIKWLKAYEAKNADCDMAIDVKISRIIATINDRFIDMEKDHLIWFYSTGWHDGQEEILNKVGKITYTDKGGDEGGKDLYDLMHKP